MSVYKDEKNGSWYAMVRFEDWTGQRKQKCKRGFSTKREALEWERTFQQQSAGDLDMTFEAFCELYEKDMRPRLKESTWATKDHITRTKLLPYFGKRRLCELNTKDIIAWQNTLLAYRDEKKRPYSPTYVTGGKRTSPPSGAAFRNDQAGLHHRPAFAKGDCCARQSPRIQGAERTNGGDTERVKTH